MNRKLQIVNAMAMGMTSLLLVACNGASVQQEPGPNTPVSFETATWGQAIATGQPSHLKQFDVNLRQVLGLPDLESYFIGCVEGCDQFTNPGLTRLVYVFPREHPGILTSFGKAWDETQRPTGDGSFAVEFNAEITHPTCTGPSDPPPCQSMPFCAIDRCGRMVSGKPNCAIC